MKQMHILDQMKPEVTRAEGAVCHENVSAPRNHFP